MLLHMLALWLAVLEHVQSKLMVRQNYDVSAAAGVEDMAFGSSSKNRYGSRRVPVARWAGRAEGGCRHNF